MLPKLLRLVRKRLVTFSELITYFTNLTDTTALKVVRFDIIEDHVNFSNHKAIMLFLSGDVRKLCTARKRFEFMLRNLKRFSGTNLFQLPRTKHRARTTTGSMLAGRGVVLYFCQKPSEIQVQAAHKKTEKRRKKYWLLIGCLQNCVQNIQKVLENTKVKIYG